MERSIILFIPSLMRMFMPKIILIIYLFARINIHCIVAALTSSPPPAVLPCNDSCPVYAWLVIISPPLPAVFIHTSAHDYNQPKCGQYEESKINKIGSSGGRLSLHCSKTRSAVSVFFRSRRVKKTHRRRRCEKDAGDELKRAACSREYAICSAEVLFALNSVKIEISGHAPLTRWTRGWQTCLLSRAEYGLHVCSIVRILEGWQIDDNRTNGTTIKSVSDVSFHKITTTSIAWVQNWIEQWLFCPKSIFMWLRIYSVIL